MSASPAAQSTTAAVVGAMSAPSGYTLSANDQVAIEVFGEEDLRTNGRLNGEGNLSLPLLGSVHLGGLTLAQAASRITELYGRDYLVNPKVNITLVGYAKRRFTILGQINRPGNYEMPEGSPTGLTFWKRLRWREATLASLRLKELVFAAGVQPGRTKF